MFYPNCSNTGFSLLIYYSTFYTNTTYCISVTSSLINRPIINLISSSCCLFTVSSAGPVRWRTYHVPAPRYCPVINTAFASDWPNLSTEFFLYSGLVFLFFSFSKESFNFYRLDSISVILNMFYFSSVFRFVYFLFYHFIFFFIFNLFFLSYLWFIFLMLIFVHRLLQCLYFVMKRFIISCLFLADQCVFGYTWTWYSSSCCLTQDFIIKLIVLHQQQK